MNTKRIPVARRLLSGGLLVAALAGCSFIPERVESGTPRADIESRLGRPTLVHPLPGGGTRLQYSGQPSGQWVHNLDLGTDGRLVRNEQVLEIAWLQQNVQIGRWTREDVLRSLGRPALVEHVARFDGQVWTYRFQEMALPRQAHVHLDPSGVVRQMMFTDEIRADDAPSSHP